MLDLLALIHLNEIDLEEAEEIYDQIVGKTAELWQELGLSKYEATAFAHGACFEDLVQFRYGGWPTTCYLCQQPLDYRQFGWWFKLNERDEPCLAHIKCLPIYPDEEDAPEEIG